MALAEQELSTDACEFLEELNRLGSVEVLDLIANEFTTVRLADWSAAKLPEPSLFGPNLTERDVRAIFEADRQQYNGTPHAGLVIQYIPEWPPRPVEYAIRLADAVANWKNAKRWVLFNSEGD